ncbi:MAG: ATP-binding protein [Clostridiales Family XIII bacterium]|jgi:predicted AAA+ superfamily ATPase|nr:ATP-binding protein [Clostridiales Family XIII bacterium]
MKYIKRSMESIVIKLNTQYPAILITGPGQVGKTTMLRKLMESENRKRKYVTLDDLNDRTLAKTDPKMFLEIYPPPVLIDEVQYAPELFSYIKIHIDESHTPGSFRLTGSQLFKLMTGIQESLAGRVALLHLPPLSQQELYGGIATAFELDLEAVSEILKSYQNTGMEAFLYYYRDKDATEIDLIIEGDGKLYPVEIKKTAAPDRKLINVFKIIEKSPLERGVGAVLCIVEKLSAFDSENLIVPIGLI